MCPWGDLWCAFVSPRDSRARSSSCRRGIEGVSDRDENCLMRPVLGRIPFDDDLASGNRQIHPDMVEPALALSTGARFDDDTASHDASEVAAQPRGSLANMRFHEQRGRHVAEGDLKRDLHMLSMTREGFNPSMVPGAAP